MIGDPDLSIAKAWGMLPAAAFRRTAAKRTPADNQTVRNGVRHRPRQEDQAHPGLPDDHRPQFDEVLRVMNRYSSPPSTKSPLR